jgi:FixJ family two-component response regulator
VNETRLSIVIGRSPRANRTPRSDQEIADSLFIAASTAGTHVKNVMRKTGVKSRRELVFFVDAVGS